MYKYIYLGYTYDYYDYIYNNVASNNPNVFFCRPPLSNKHKIIKALYYCLSKVKLKPFSDFYNHLFIDRNLINQFNKSENLCFMVYYGVILDRGIKFIKALKQDWPNSKIVVHFTDTIEHCKTLNSSFDIGLIKKNCDIVLSYNEIDAKQFGLIIDRPKVIDYSWIQCENRNCENIDVFFIGRDKGRLEQIISIYRFLTEKGLNCQFYLVGVPKEKQVYSDQIHYTDYIPYRKNIELVAMSKCILNLIQSGAEGITLRDYEAIGMNKSIITNNPSIFTSEFYTEQKVIDVENLEDEYFKITASISIDWNGKQEYSIDNYYKWLNTLLSQ